MTEHTVARREFNRAAIISMLTAFATTPEVRIATAAPRPEADRTVIKQQLPGEPQRDLILVEVTYPPGTGSPPHEHPNGVMAFVMAGSVVSKSVKRPNRRITLEKLGTSLLARSIACPAMPAPRIPQRCWRFLLRRKGRTPPIWKS